MKKPKLKKYPIGGTKGFIPDTMVHYIGAGEVPYSKDQLSSMGYNYETSTGGFDEYSMGNNRRFYKTILPGTPEWNNPENPYLNAVASTQPVVKPAPKLKWPTRTDYSKGSKGPIYDVPTFGGGGSFYNPSETTNSQHPVFEDPRMKAAVMKRYADQQDAYYQSLRKELDDIQNKQDVSSRKRAGEIMQILLSKRPDLVKKETNVAKDSGKVILGAGKYIFPGAAPVFNAIESGVGAIEYAQNPNVSNAAGTFLDAAGYATPNKAFQRAAQYAGDILTANEVIEQKANGGTFRPIPEKDSLYIEDRLKKDPYLSSKYKYKVVEDRKKGDILYRTMPNGKDVPVNFTNMRELDRQAYKVKMDRDLMEAGQKPIYNVFAPPTFKHGGMKLPKYYNGGTESSSMIEDYRAQDGSNFWDGANGQESYYKSQEPVAPAAYGEKQKTGYQPNYNAMVGASSMATANYANVYQDPDATTSDKAAAGRQGAAQIAGSINPMIGGIIGGVDAIAQPIKNNAEQMNSKGELTNRNKARAGAIAGNILSPSTLATTIASGKWDLKGDKYLNELESDAQAQIAAEQAPMLAAAEAKRNMYYTYAQGGVHSGMHNAEVEKQEVMRMPDGSTTQVDGPTHDNGGVPVNIPDGTQIFSDRLKDPTTKKTFAKMAEKYKIKDVDDKANHLAKSSKELVDQIKQRKLDELFAKQEQLKQAKLNKYAQKLGLSDQMFKQGGTKLPKFDGGGTWVNGVWVPNSTTNYGYSTPEGTFTPGLDGKMVKTADSYGQPVGFDSPLPMITNQDLENRNNMELRAAQDASIPKIQDVNSISKPSTGRKMNSNWIEPAANTLIQNAGNIAYLAEQGKKYDKQDFYKYSPELYNPADALRQADIEARVTRDRLKDASGGNAGALMSNLTQAQAINTMNKSKIRTDASNINNQILNDAQTRNIQGKYMVDDINARNKGQALTNYYKAIQGIGMNTTQAYTDWKRGNMDKNTANMLGSMFQNYGLDINNPNDWKIFLKKSSNKE